MLKGAGEYPGFPKPGFADVTLENAMNPSLFATAIFQLAERFVLSEESFSLPLHFLWLSNCHALVLRFHYSSPAPSFTQHPADHSNRRPKPKQQRCCSATFAPYQITYILKAFNKSPVFKGAIKSTPEFLFFSRSIQ